MLTESNIGKKYFHKTLLEEKMRLRENEELRELRNKIVHGSEHIDSRTLEMFAKTIIHHYQMHLELEFGSRSDLISKKYTAVSLPRPYTEIERRPCDSTSAYSNHIYVYAKHPNGCCGFKVIGKKQSRFYKLGRIKDPNSIIGRFIRTFPAGKALMKSDILEIGLLGLINVRDGRRLKALLDILEIEGYLRKKTLFHRGQRISYQKTSKSYDQGDQKLFCNLIKSEIVKDPITNLITVNGLEVENNDELKVHVSSKPIASSGRVT